MSDYSMWVLEYGQIKETPTSSLVYGAHNAGTLRLPYCYVVLRGRGHTAMVDVGYNYYDHSRAFVERFGPTDWHTPTETLALVGLKPEDIDTVFITHAHFDHMGNLGDFPNAHVYVQEEELAKQIWAMSLPPRLQFPSMGTDPGDLLRCLGLVREGRVTLLNGDVEDILPGIDVRLAADSHTPGSMYVVVRNDGQATSEDSWVFAGDLAYTQANMAAPGAVVGVDTMYVPVGLAAGSLTKCILAQEAMMKTVGYDPRRVVAVHEDKLVDMFPSRIVEEGSRVIEIALADGESSKVN